jgi:hypothetical protein
MKFAKLAKTLLKLKYGLAAMVSNLIISLRSWRNPLQIEDYSDFLKLMQWMVGFSMRIL